ncbi:MAG TPA: hypothetical protein VHS57_00600 [Acidimicrobiales bacterium]|nr:hypothetical protein [Acidimicrobiales bacterium]
MAWAALGPGIDCKAHDRPFHFSATGAPGVPTTEPVASHFPVVVHETLDRDDLAVGDGEGIVWVAHVVPFHRSASTTLDVVPLEALPTASHAVAAEHDTPLRTLEEGEVAGVVWTAQLEPLHRSAKDTRPFCPTASQTAAAHDTAFNAAYVLPVGAGGFWTFQAVPFQTMASGTLVPDEFT